MIIRKNLTKYQNYLILQNINMPYLNNALHAVKYFRYIHNKWGMSVSCLLFQQENTLMNLKVISFFIDIECYDLGITSSE